VAVQAFLLDMRSATARLAWLALARSMTRLPAVASILPRRSWSSLNDALRFTSLAVTSSREDFRLQVDARAGRTKQKDRLAAVSPKSGQMLGYPPVNGSTQGAAFFASFC